MRGQDGRALWIALGTLLLLTAGFLAWTALVPRGGPDIGVRAREQAPIDANALSARLIPDEDLPPTGTRSLFDHLIAQNEQLPYPFDRLIALLAKQNPSGAAPLAVLIPHGRSLLKAQADDAHPRVVVAADFEAPNTAAAFGLAPRGKLFLGFVENAHEIEVLSYNEAAGRYEFQLVQNYCEGCVPKLVYARRAVCRTCHQGGAPIFPQRPWNETNGQPETAAQIIAARGNEQPYLSVALRQGLAVPERFEELVDVGDFIPVTQRAWLDGCGDGEAGTACRRQMLRVALLYLWNPGEFDAKGAEPNKLRELQAAGWPQAGIAVPDGDLRNRDPLGERRGFKNWVRGLFARKLKPGEGAKSNEDLEAFDKLPKLPPELDPLSPRPPKRVLAAGDLDGAFGLAALIADSDFKQLEAQAGQSIENLLAAVDRAEDAAFAPGPFVRVKAVNALRAALGEAQALDYCCLSTAELSPPVASGEPPVAIRDGSPVKRFEQYCFACHRSNPSQRLNFMAGKTEDEVLANIKGKSEIRDALDWTRYRGSDRENKLMPPADSRQRAALEAAVKQNPKLLDEMRDVVPSLF